MWDYFSEPRNHYIVKASFNTSFDILSSIDRYSSYYFMLLLFLRNLLSTQRLQFRLLDKSWLFIYYEIVEVVFQCVLWSSFSVSSNFVLSHGNHHGATLYRCHRKTSFYFIFIFDQFLMTLCCVCAYNTMQNYHGCYKITENQSIGQNVLWNNLFFLLQCNL